MKENLILSLNPREKDVLNILWESWNESEKSMISSEIVNASAKKFDTPLTQSTVTAVLRKLLNAKLVEVAGIEHSGKVLSRTYKPAVESKTALINDFVEQYKAFRDVVPLEELYSALETVAASSSKK